MKAGLSAKYQHVPLPDTRIPSVEVVHLEASYRLPMGVRIQSTNAILSPRSHVLGIGINSVTSPAGHTSPSIPSIPSLPSIPSIPSMPSVSRSTTSTTSTIQLSPGEAVAAHAYVIPPPPFSKVS